MSKANPTQTEITILEIQEAAKLLPDFYRNYEKDQLITGEKAALTGIKTINGEPVDRKKVYKVAMPVPHKVNHADEMVKIYTHNRKKVGHDAAYQLVAEYIHMVKQQADA